MSNIETWVDCQRVKPASIAYDEATNLARNALETQTAEARRVYDEAERVFDEACRVFAETTHPFHVEYEIAVANARSVFWRAVGEPEKAERCTLVTRW